MKPRVFTLTTWSYARPVGVGFLAAAGHLFCTCFERPKPLGQSNSDAWSLPQRMARSHGPRDSKIQVLQRSFETPSGLARSEGPRTLKVWNLPSLRETLKDRLIEAQEALLHQSKAFLSRF